MHLAACGRASAACPQTAHSCSWVCLSPAAACSSPPAHLPTLVTTASRATLPACMCRDTQMCVSACAGNHQTYALDIGFLVEGLLREAGVMPRGLAHPVIFEVCAPKATNCLHDAASAVRPVREAASAPSCPTPRTGPDLTSSKCTGWRQLGLWQLHADLWCRESWPHQLLQVSRPSLCILPWFDMLPFLQHRLADCRQCCCSSKHDVHQHQCRHLQARVSICMVQAHEEQGVGAALPWRRA